MEIGNKIRGVSPKEKSDSDVPIGRRGEEVSDRTAEIGHGGGVGKASAKTGRVPPTRKRRKRLDSLLPATGSQLAADAGPAQVKVRSEEPCDLRCARPKMVRLELRFLCFFGCEDLWTSVCV